ncbi:hypothetical protein BT96DRAFT_397637 [Gymnopus androsaceus JB14]|uniref:Uncharacterized protein n=1 Tax=Gymnopus androsaceus JB14 TaxID=1447944 RepID=A0A6A4I378_9AGAR|nr:hypothetical protein BT96DRAFT_397637 [Gymnopus androsaceus JB14]
MIYRMLRESLCLKHCQFRTRRVPVGNLTKVLRVRSANVSSQSNFVVNFIGSGVIVLVGISLLQETTR